MKFKKLYQKIYLSLFLLCLGLLLVIDALSITVFAISASDSHKTLGQMRIERIKNSCSLYISSLASTIYNLSQNESLIDGLDSSDSSIIETLDDTCNYSMRINAITVYNTSGESYCSSRISEPPSLDALRSNSALNTFFESDAKDFLSLRISDVADFYNNLRYPDEMGVITYCRKVYDGERLVGYIFADVLPSNLYSYFDADNQNTIAFITFDGKYFVYSGNNTHADLLSNANGYFEYFETTEEGFSVILFESRAEINSQILLFCLILAGISAAVIVALHLASHLLAWRITRRLDNFLERMESEIKL